MHPQTTATPEVRQRYRRIAGPFTPHETGLLAAAIHFLTTTGARVVTVGESAGTNIWRLRSECESIDDTRRRLQRYS